MPAATRSRFIRRAPWVPSTSRVPRDTQTASEQCRHCRSQSYVPARPSKRVASCQDEAECIVSIGVQLFPRVLPHLRMLLSHVGYSADGRRVRGFVHARTIEGTGGVAECPLHAA